MRLLILEDADQVAEWAATLVAKRIRTFKPTPDRHFVLGLPTGGTPLKMYQKLIQLYKEGKVSFKYVTTFNMDEYVGIPYNHPGSYHHYMFENFFQHIDIDPSNAHLLDGNAPDLDAECRLYEENIKRAGGINLFVGGMGPDGHIAFNEPGSSMTSRTRVKSLAYDTVAANARFFGGDIDAVPKQALTVGVGTVMDGKELLILVTGAAKAIALHNVVECGINHMWTASIIQQHPAASIVCDDDATLELKVKTVNYFKSLKAVNMKLVED